MAIALVSKKTDAACIQSLRARGFHVLLCPLSSVQNATLAYHTDMQLARLGKRIFCSEDFFLENARFFSSLSALCESTEVIPLPDAAGTQYPTDCAYNVLAMGNALFYNPKSIAPSLLGEARARGYRLYETRQGYSACSVFPLGEHYAITADRGMEKALSHAGIEVLKIRSGGIALPHYEYGFIGGAGGTYRHTAYFFGNIANHPDFAAMEKFARAAGFSLLSLSDMPLTDLGGIFFIEQDTD